MWERHNRVQWRGIARNNENIWNSHLLLRRSVTLPREREPSRGHLDVVWCENSEIQNAPRKNEGYYRDGKIVRRYIFRRLKAMKDKKSGAFLFVIIDFDDITNKNNWQGYNVPAVCSSKLFPLAKRAPSHLILLKR